MTYGTIKSGSAGSLGADDDVYLVVQVPIYVTAADWYATYNGVAASPASIQVTYAGKSSLTCSQTAYLYKWSTATWTQVGLTTVGTSEVSTTYTLTTSPSSYVSGGSLRVRLRCLGSLPSFTHSTDRLTVATT